MTGLLAFFGRRWQLVLLLAAGLFLAVTSLAARSDRVERSRIAAEMVARDTLLARQAATIARLVDSVAALEIVRQEATEAVTVEVVRWRTLRDTIQITDTVQVKAALEEADSLAAVCSVVVRTCDQAVAARDALLVERSREAELLRGQLAALEKMQPGRSSRLLSTLKVAGGAFVAGAGVHALLR